MSGGWSIAMVLAVGAGHSGSVALGDHLVK